MKGQEDKTLQTLVMEKIIADIMSDSHMHLFKWQKYSVLKNNRSSGCLRGKWNTDIILREGDRMKAKVTSSKASLTEVNLLIYLLHSDSCKHTLVLLDLYIQLVVASSCTYRMLTAYLNSRFFDCRQSLLRLYSRHKSLVHPCSTEHNLIQNGPYTTSSFLENVRKT